MSAAPTPKQHLIAHLEAGHTGPARRRRISARWTQAELAEWHARQHHRYATNHYHVGPNTGPNDRPLGWYTGADAVPKVAS